MPLLNGKPFCTEKLPTDLKGNEEIFVCRQTNEVFRDYESFFKRQILCNSLVWSCDITLKNGLTYEEAVQSEKEARKIVKHVPLPIKRGVLTLVHYTRHSRLSNLCDEVFNYIRDRFQEGEEIDVKYKGEKLLGFIHSVIEPTTLSNGHDSPKLKSKLSSPSSKSNKTKSLSTSDDVVVLNGDEDEHRQVKSPTRKQMSAWPDAKSYQYVVKLKQARNTPSKAQEFITVRQNVISRKKGAFSREKLKILLRLTCCRTAAKQEAGHWRVKDEYRKEFDLLSDVDEANESISAERTSKKRKRGGENKNGKKNKKIVEKLDSKKNKTVGKIVKAKLTAEEIEKLKEELQLKKEKEKELRKQERDKARLERSELLKEQKMFLLHWCVPQDDLDLVDHKELPKPVPVETKFSTELFGDVIMVLEFLDIFGEFFGMKQDFPDGVSIAMIEEALTEHDAEGSFYDIIRFLLSAILKTHAEEEEDEGLDDIHEDHVSDTRPEEDEDERVSKAVSASAAMAAAWAQVYQGKDLHELTLDPFTCSEILRLHFLSSGASLVGDGDEYRWQRRGGFTLSDDAGVAFRRHEHAIMRTLVTSNVYDLNSVEKLKILVTLCSQLLTYATTRDIIDDGFHRFRKAKRELQEEQWADQRKDKEEAAAKYKKRLEEKAKEREKRNKVAEGEKPADEASSEQDVSKPIWSESVTEEGKAFTRSQGSVINEKTTKIEDSEEIERWERKENLRKKEKSFLKEIKKSQSMSGVQPIGTDRLFRRYWIFKSLHGLFIEDNDPHLSKLLQKEINEIVISDDDSHSETASISTEEDVPGPSTTTATPHHPSSITSLSKRQIEGERDLCRILKLYNISVENLPENCVLNRGAESGIISLKREQHCAKLNSREIVQWSYIDKKEDLDKLLSALNPRGFREKHLRESLLEAYDALVKGIPDNPFKLENKQLRESAKQTAMSNRNETVDKSLYKTMEDFIEASLRDQILDLEDRIGQAGLGFVKTDDITAWRKHVENGIYDFLPDAKSTPLANGIEKENNDIAMEIDQEVSSANHVSDSTTEKMEVDRPQVFYDVKVKLLCEESRPQTPVDGSFTSTPSSSRTPLSINPCVRDLAKALLQVSQGIERKYLIPPLGDDEETKKRKQQEAADAAKRDLEEAMAANKKKKGSKNEINESEKQQYGKSEAKSKPQQKTQLERWEESLLACTNLAQVSIHLTNLDNSISWDKSVLNARCRLCRRKGDAEHMLLCDGCDKGHHIYCLKPPLKQIPEGDWFCSQCRPIEPRRKVRRRKAGDEDSDVEERQDMKLLEMEQNEIDDESGSDDAINSDDDEEDSGDDSEDVSEDGSEQSSDDDSSVHMETCACCEGGGELLCCETCPLVYHLECAYPPLRRIPRGDWMCQVCTGADHELPAGRRVKKTVIKDAQKQVKHQTKPVAKRAKIEVKPKQKLNKVRPNTKEQKTTARGKRLSTRTTARANSGSPKTLPPSGLPNSARTKSTRLSAALTKKCEKLLEEMMVHEESWPFLVPVDNVKVPDYFTIIKTPMDLQTIQTKLLNNEYSSTDAFAADVRQVFFNCSEYNKPRTREARAGIQMSAYFETRFGELGLDTNGIRGPRTRRSR